MPRAVYPSWSYHLTLGSRLVNSASEFYALGNGWSYAPLVNRSSAIATSADGSTVTTTVPTVTTNPLNGSDFATLPPGVTLEG